MDDAICLGCWTYGAQLVTQKPVEQRRLARVDLAADHENQG